MNYKLSPDKKRMLLLTDGNIDQASARIRAIQYIPLFENAGFIVRFIPRVCKKSTNNFLRYFIFPLVKRYLWIMRMKALFFESWDIIFIQRSFLNESLLRKLTNRTPVIFDFDDAIYLSDTNLSARKKTEIMIRNADEIIISTGFLNEVCSQLNRKGIIIPTPVDTEKIKPANEYKRDVLTIGWIGSSWTTEYLKVIEKALQEINKEIQFNLLTIGARSDYRIPGINHISKEWSFEEENKFINEMDIGIMPLPLNDFTIAKGGYKLYLYMAGGIPCVASPVGVNNLIIRDGENGFLASTEKEWIEALKKLLRDPQLRKSLGQTGRNDAVKYYDRTICFRKINDIVNGLVYGDGTKHN
jgi:glycosyltransferase involved in cell wall biosynthesis